MAGLLPRVELLQLIFFGLSSEAIQLRSDILIPPSSAGNYYSELLLFDLVDFFYLIEAICCGVEALLTVNPVIFTVLGH